ncbi:MAG TPA: O-antigen ligase family protein [Gemmatimonadales bacterium]
MPARVGGPAVAPPLNRALWWSFCLLVASIPFEFPERSFPVEIPTLTAALFLAATLLQPSACYKRRPPVVLWLFGYLYMFWLTAAWAGRDALATDLNGAEYWSQVLKLFLLLFEVVLVFWAAYNLMSAPRVGRTVLALLAVACAVRALLPFVGIARTSHVIWGGGQRVTALGQNANNSAMILGAGFIALIGLQYALDRPFFKRRWVAWPLLGLLVVSMVDTGSRGGLVGLGMGLMAFALGGAQRTWLRVRNAAVAVLAIGGIVFVSYRSDVVRRRFTDTLERGELAGREQIYPALFHMFAERPLTGWGPVNNKYELGLRLDERVRRRRDAHNLVLEVLTASGVLGTVPFVAAVGLCCLGAWRARRGPHGVVPLALTATVMMANVSGNWIASKLLWITLAYAIASAGYPVTAIQAARARFATPRPDGPRPLPAPFPELEPR